ncbi:hypothetical protein CEE45_10805 [Candidatus Heimdallarchaeota archaeon B3_Heim]|nr:MAG: hypothetical protein CEE45_10805 [Candidatus Heimdallarchaeota archaeon B3_Heim]
MIKIKKILLPLAFLSIILLLSGGLGFASATPDVPGDGLENGDLDRDRDRDRYRDQDHDCTCDGSGECECYCPCPSDGGDGGDSNPGDGKRNCYGPPESHVPKMAKIHWELEWQYRYQYRWDPAPE